MHSKSENFETQLQETQEELAQANFQLDRTQYYFQQYQAVVRDTLALLQTSRAQLHQVQDELAETQAQLQQAQTERDKYQSRLHLMQWELERSQFQLAIASQTLESSHVQYKLLVWDAWYAYRKGDLAGMSQCLHASVKCTPFSKTKTISSWLNSFAEFSVNKGESLDVQCLSNTYEWKQVIDRILGYPKMTAN
jgi:chromosome segregation ATPase